MTWVLVIVAVCGVGLPVAGWWLTRRPRARTWDRGTGEIDRWLRDEFRLGWPERNRVQRAVTQGREPQDPALAAAARALAAEVLAGRFRVLRMARWLGWFQLASALGCNVAGIVLLTASHGPGLTAAGALAIVNAVVLIPLLIFGSVHAPRRLRRSAQRLLRQGPGKVTGR